MPNLASCHLAGNKLRFEVQPGQVIYVVFIYIYIFFFLNAYIICMHDIYIYTHNIQRKFGCQSSELRSFKNALNFSKVTVQSSNSSVK